jgi:hypothetical protein
MMLRHLTFHPAHPVFLVGLKRTHSGCETVKSKSPVSWVSDARLPIADAVVDHNEASDLRLIVLLVFLGMARHLKT